MYISVGPTIAGHLAIIDYRLSKCVPNFLGSFEPTYFVYNHR